MLRRRQPPDTVVAPRACCRRPTAATVAPRQAPRSDIMNMNTLSSRNTSGIDNSEQLGVPKFSSEPRFEPRTVRTEPRFRFSSVQFNLLGRWFWFWFSASGYVPNLVQTGSNLNLIENFLTLVWIFNFQF